MVSNIQLCFRWLAGSSPLCSGLFSFSVHIDSHVSLFVILLLSTTHAVYNRENREKVLRDEAAHEEELCRLREKQEQADREYRRNILLQRARRRHGGSVVVNLDANNDVESEALQTDTRENTLPERDAWTTHDLGSPANISSIVHEDVDRRRNESFFSSVRASANDRNGVHGEGPMSLLNLKIEHDTSSSLATKSLRGHPDHASVGSKDVRAHEYASLHSAARTSHTIMQTDDASSSPRWHDDAKTRSIRSHHRSDGSVAKLEHINLFAEEEARARNPERSEEDRVSRRRRGNVKTQTTDSKFDEKFGFAYGLTGQGAVPWYASSSHQKRDGLQQQQEEDDERFGASRRIGSEVTGASARMEEWKRRAEEALIEHHHTSKPASITGTKPARKESDVAGVDGLPNESTSVIDAVMLSDVQRKKQKGNRVSLLGSVRIISSTERDSKRVIKKGGSSMNGDSIVPNREHGDRHDVENRRTRDDRDGNEPERKTNEKRRRRSDVHGGGEASSRHNADGSASYKSTRVQGNDKWRALREERMKREAEERKRQRETIRKALGDAAAEEERSVKRRYHSGYGYGR